MPFLPTLKSCVNRQFWRFSEPSKVYSEKIALFRLFMLLKGLYFVKKLQETGVLKNSPLWEIEKASRRSFRSAPAVFLCLRRCAALRGGTPAETPRKPLRLTIRAKRPGVLRCLVLLLGASLRLRSGCLSSTRCRVERNRPFRSARYAASGAAEPSNPCRPAASVEACAAYLRT